MTITNRTTQWKGKYLKTSVLDYRDRHGISRQWEIVERIGTDGVVIIVGITQDNDVILIRQYRPALDAYVIELPAGLIEPGEAPLETARRELIEETGFVPSQTDVLTNGVLSTGIVAEHWHAIIATGARKATRQERKLHMPDESEDIEVLSVPLDGFQTHLQQMEREGGKIDIRIFGLVELARLKTETRS